MMSKQLMNFRSYVLSLNSLVDENTAYKKYKDFMANLSQSKVCRFFEANKDREWFRLKYHPIENQVNVHSQNVNFMKRLKIYTELRDRGFFDTFSFNIDNAQTILNLMDAIIVYLEDGPQTLVGQLLSKDATSIDAESREKYVPTRPTSVVADDISIEATVCDIQQICAQANSNLLRIAPLNPYYVEEGQLRRKIVAIYSQPVDIREVCWKLSRSKLNDRPINVHVNKCVTDRVKTISPISNHPICIVSDIRNAIILILNFDEYKCLYGKRKQLLETIQPNAHNDVNQVKMEESIKDENTENINNVAPPSPPGSEKSGKDDDGEDKTFDITTIDEDKEKDKKKLLDFKFNFVPSYCRLARKINKSKNPILEGAYKYLVEFCPTSSDMAYQLSMVPKELHDDDMKHELESCEQDKVSNIEMIVKNLPHPIEECTKFLDRLIWYLRIVHSFDYYTMTHYKQEDDLTLKMSVVHVRDSPSLLPIDMALSPASIRDYILQNDQKLVELGHSHGQKFVTKDEERYNYRSYGKVINDELSSYSQRIQKPKSNETEEVYKCRHCTRVFQKRNDIGRHFVSKHQWAIDAIKLETDYFNAYLFDCNKIDPCPPKELLEVPSNRYARMTNLSQMGEDPDLLQQTLEAYSKMESFVREPAPRSQVESDPRNDMIVDYTDISFDDAI